MDPLGSASFERKATRTMEDLASDDPFLTDGDSEKSGRSSQIMRGSDADRQSSILSANEEIRDNLTIPE